MFYDLDLYMPRLSPEAFEYIVLRIAVALQVRVPSLACGAVISNRIRAYLADPRVDAWRLIEGCKVCCLHGRCSVHCNALRARHASRSRSSCRTRKCSFRSGTRSW